MANPPGSAGTASSARTTPSSPPRIEIPRPRSGTAAAAAVADTIMGLKAVARRAARDAERLAIKDMLERVHWNRAKAARLLQISYKALLYKIVDCGLASPASEKEEELAAAS